MFNKYLKNNNKPSEEEVNERTRLLNAVEIQVSDTETIITSNDKEDQTSISNESVHNQELGCYSNPGMTGSEENDVLVNNNNYGTINGSNGSVKTKLHIDISRDVIDFDDLYHKYGKRVPAKKTLCGRVRRSADNWCQSCSPLALLPKLFPIIDWMGNYSIRSDLLSDVIVGITILILHIPQGMAYGMLAGLPAINGLYVSFFPVVIYSLMGTSRHLSIGTFAVISIMCSNTAQKLNALPVQSSTGLSGFARNSSQVFATNATSDPTVDYDVLQVLTALCMLTGVFQAVMGFIHLGVLSIILSDTLVSAFSTGCAIHVATSQLANLFDLQVKNYELLSWLPFKLIKDWIAIFAHLGDTNVVTLGLSIFGIALLVLVKEVVEPRLKRRFRFNLPLPIDILLVIGFTVFSMLMDLHARSGVSIMGDIPTGLPEPRLPPLELFPKLVVDALVIAIVAFAVSLSLAKMYAKRHKYRIDANQELLALGAANIFSSLFGCYPSAASLSRSSVQDRIGGRTQMTSLVSSVGMLVFLLFLGPLLHHLPKTTLSCIILVALKSMFLQFTDFVRSWRISKLEASQWMLTFIAVILLGVDIGLIVGVLFSLLVVLLRFATPKSTINGQLPFSEIYVDSDEFLEAKQLKGLKIFQFHCPLFFMNAHNFKTNLYKKALDISNDEIERLKEEKPLIHTIVIDLSSVFFIDSTGVETIVEVIQELDDCHIKVVLCHCSQTVIQMLQKMDFFGKVMSPTIYTTVHDAVVQNVTAIA